MVYKASKGGVRSGNTLRCLRSYRTRRYYRQACIVGRSNMKPTEVPEFLDSHIEDELISSSLGSTDVALSLNKKKRWLLPATVGHMIKTGSFNDEKTMVSLLERHKLKRRANCVSFVCNQGRVRHVAPRQKRYFSFKLNNAGNTVSNRQRKYQAATLRKHVNHKKVKITRDKYNMKTVEVITLLGSETIPDTSTSFTDSKPELRLEVFYPCPQSCSLTYNPKYTNVHMEFSEEGGVELTSQKKVVRKGRRTRKRFTLKDLKKYDQETASSDTDGFWEDDSEKSEDDTAPRATSLDSNQTVEDNLKTSFKNPVENNEDSYFSTEEVKVHENDNVLASLIVQAEQARSLCDGRDRRRRMKHSRKRVDTKARSSNSEDKSHIIYTSDPNFSSKSRNASKTSEPIIKNNYVTLNFFKVILKSGETTPGNLRAKFGRFYAEAASEPRRFMIDVTEDVQSLVCPYRDAELSAVFTSFLVFVHDGVYDEGLDTFKVIFNSNCCPETEVFKTCISFEETSIAEIMSRVACFVVDIKENKLLDFSCSQIGGNVSIPMINFVMEFMNVSVTSFRACDEIRRVPLTEVIQENIDLSTSMDSIVRDLDCDIFCDICYESINPTQAWDVSGTRLLKCSHIFCDDCWRSHLRAKLKDGSLKMRCPGYDCDETVGPVTMLSLLHVSEVSKFFQRKCENEADSSTNSRWCPNRDCGRVIKLDVGKSANIKSLDVTCSCGHEFCFTCLSHPHWPATCDQAEKYDEKLLTLKSLTISENELISKDLSSVSPPEPAQKKGKTKVLEFEGKLCPKCSNFIEKNGGCQHMSCKCGYSFCWFCFKEFSNHSVCTPNPFVVYEHTVKLKVRHIVLPTIPSLPVPGAPSKPEPVKTRQKTTLYRKAMQEKQEVCDFKYTKQVKEMADKIAKATRKDLSLKRKILSLCGLQIDDKDPGELIRFPVGPHVTKFLRSCCELKRALHHVAEYTFVLLQDTADSVDKRRALRLANDLSGYCSFIRSILESGQRQDMGAAVKRLADIQTWVKRALGVLRSTVDRLKR